MPVTIVLAYMLSAPVKAAAEETYPVPPPCPVQTEVRVGTYVFPGWYRNPGISDYPYPNHDQRSEWPRVREHLPSRPLLGFYDDSKPEVNDWHIKWALEAGISWFAFDWYWNAGEKRLSRTLERGFLNAQYGGMMDFCIHWCNHGLDWKEPLDQGPDALEAIMRYCAENYFGRPNYLKIGQRPVFMVWDMHALLDANGGQEEFSRDVLPRLTRMCQEAGFDGLYLIAVHNAPDRLKGITCVDAATGYSYAWRTPREPFNPPGSRPYKYMIEALPDYWREIQETLSVPFLVSTQSGWDNTPRAVGMGREKTLWVLTDNSTDLFERTLRDAKAQVHPDLPFFLVEAWNEWGEGSFIEPSSSHGFGHLDAIRRTFAPDAPPAEWAKPSPDQIAQYQVPASTGPPSAGRPVDDPTSVMGRGGTASRGAWNEWG